MPESVSKVADLEEFEFDLCTDFVGVKCPLPVGTSFEGIATWNGELKHIYDRLAVVVVPKNRDGLVAGG